MNAALQFTVDVTGSDIAWALKGGLIALVAAAILAGVIHGVGEIATFGFGGGSYRENFTKAAVLFVPSGALASGLTSAFGWSWWGSIPLFIGCLVLVYIIAALVYRLRRH
ncbi:MAG TPA: hypothetical protein VJM32_02075 [Candidatus Saccharimonadales bacterium]|nr:hypothetical protein [Candidatus Saccharimonadales bacterium]